MGTARADGQRRGIRLPCLARTGAAEGYRRVLELKLVEEQSNQEIARRLGLNESTVATRIQRGKAMLRERLKKEGYCYE